MIPTRILLALSVAALAGCATPVQTYVSQHPELPPTQRQILARGEIPAGEAVAGMTHDEVKLAMHGYPMAFDKIDGAEAWVYLRKNSRFPGPNQKASGPSGGRPVDLRESASQEPPANVRTTIFFQCDRATRAEVRREPLAN